MKQSRSWRIMLAQIPILTPIAVALAAVHGTYAGDGPFHVAIDWSHRYLVFSPPKTDWDSNSGTELLAGMEMLNSRMLF
jgi:hypothetical protein